MPTEAGQVYLRIRLTASLWARLKARAAARAVSLGNYADLIFRYALFDRAAEEAPSSDGPSSDQLNDEHEEPVYFTTELPVTTRQQLEAWSELEQCSLATFAGRLVGSYLERHERDPRDLAMIHYLTLRLEAAPVVSDDELREAIRRCEQKAGVRLPPGYWAKWLRGRLQPVISTISIGGASVELTDDLLNRLLAG